MTIRIINSKLPECLGLFSVSYPEMMFVMYMPIKLPYGSLKIPPHLEYFKHIVDFVIENEHIYGPVEDQYVYITAKHGYVNENYPGNRPGWHIDGFGSDDVNYIWTDRNPTEFCVQIFRLNEDHNESLKDMENQAGNNIQTNPENSLMRLNTTMVHRVSPIVKPGLRTFLKITFSKNRYNMQGNAHNYLLDYNWNMITRKECRNHTNG